jgi:hypothetical protein
MFSHIYVGARELERLVGFYYSILSRLGLIQMPQGDGGGAQGVGWQYLDRRRPQFYV